MKDCQTLRIKTVGFIPDVVSKNKTEPMIMWVYEIPHPAQYKARSSHEEGNKIIMPQAETGNIRHIPLKGYWAQGDVLASKKVVIINYFLTRLDLKGGDIQHVQWSTAQTQTKWAVPPQSCVSNHSGPFSTLAAMFSKEIIQVCS